MMQGVDTSKSLVIDKSPFRLMVLSLIGIGFVAISVLLISGIANESRFGNLAMPIGWIGLIFFGLMTLLAFRQLFMSPSATITFSPTGIHDIRVTKNEIPWAAVQSMGTWEMSGQKIMVLGVPPAVEDQLQLTRIARMTRKANAKLGADGLSITPQGLKTNYEDLISTTATYLDDHGAK